METTTQALGVEEVPTALATPGSAAKLIREVRAQTRRRFSAEDKIRIVLEGFRKEMPVSDLCRSEGISSGHFIGLLTSSGYTPFTLDWPNRQKPRGPQSAVGQHSFGRLAPLKTLEAMMAALKTKQVKAPFV